MILGLASIAIVLLSYFFLFKGDKKTSDVNKNESIAANENIKINEKPTDPDIIPLPKEDEENEDINDENTEGEQIDYSENEDLESANISADNSTTELEECIIIVGQFSKKSNARRFASRVEKDGYESYLGWNEEKSWNTVGVKFKYESEEEKEDMHDLLKEKYDESAWILRQ